MIVEGQNALTNKKLALMNDMTYQDLQDKITGLRGYVELANEATTDAERAAYAEKQTRLLTEIDRMIKNCKDYEQMGVNRPQWMSVATSIRIAASIVSQGPGVSVESDVGDLEVYSDPLIEKIFFNLIDNADRHAQNLTRIRFSVKIQKDELVLTCEDDGCGIPEGKRKMLFNRGTGAFSGFGLFFVRECLSMNTMTIHENGEPGKGARFEITVPKGLYRFPPEGGEGVPKRPA